MKIGIRLRRLRKLRGLTIEQLAENAQLTKGYISQLERDKTIPTVGTLKQILDVLGISLGSFFTDMEAREKNIFYKKDRLLEKEGKNFRKENLIPKLKYLEMEPLLLNLAPLSTYTEKYEEDEAFGFIVRGRLELTIEKERKIVNKGDCFYIFFDNNLEIKNLTRKTAEILLVNY